METQVCSKCGMEKPISEFYKNKKYFIKKCKDCIKQEVKERYRIHSTDEKWMEKQRKRGREKFKRLGYKGRFKSTRTICLAGANASKRLRAKGFDTKGKEAHHWNYNFPRSVFLVPRTIHRLIHKYMTVNYNDKYCYTTDGTKLETEHQAEEYFNGILSSNGIDLKITPINF